MMRRSRHTATRRAGAALALLMMAWGGGVQAQALLNPTVRTTYNANGQVTSVERGTSVGQSDAAFAAMTVLQTDAIQYDAQGRKARETLNAGSANPAVTQYSYDDAGRLTCAAARMNPATFAALPASACALAATGEYGPDRITHTTYDAADRPTEIRVGYATPEAQIERAQAYTPNGPIDWVEDGAGNRSDYAYDGFDRLSRLSFPSATVGAHAANPADYEEYGYDASDNPTTKRTRAGLLFTTTFDALDRIIHVDAPSGTPDTVFTYDNLNRRLTASGAAQTVTSSWDALGRNTAETGPLGGVGYSYDLAGRMTLLAYDDGLQIAYTRDVLGRIVHIGRKTASTPATLLARYAYDNLGRRAEMTRANGVVTAYGYNTASQLTVLAHNLAGTTQDVSYGLAYNPAGQAVQRTVSNPLYTPAPATVSAAYVNNGRNQPTTVGGAALTWSSQGNLTADGVRAFAYDALNRLTSAPRASGGAGVLSYDPLDRLYAADQLGVRLLWSGAAPIAEFTPAGAIAARHIPGPEPDEVAVSFSGSGTATGAWPVADPLGSPIALTDSSGAATQINSWDDYGRPAASNGGRFGYTGQLVLPGAGVLHYKARAYDPGLGRFLQTDPVGYEQGLNLYAYVGNDPINLTDPTGREAWLVARPVYIGGRRVADHMFVVVAPRLGATPAARFSYGPSQDYNPLDGTRALGSLVSLTNTATETNVDDAGAWEWTAGGERVAGWRGISFTRIGASDDAVIAAGNATDAALGTQDNPGSIPYHPDFGVPAGPGYANSNSAARSVAEQSTGRSQPLPAGASAPGSDRSGTVTREVCETGSRICR